MLSVRAASVGYENGPLFEEASFTLNRGDRIGVVGPNGAGKSSLLHMMRGDLAPEQGAVVTEASIGYLAQVPDFDQPVASYMDEMSDGLLSAEAELQDLYLKMSKPNVDTSAIEEEVGKLQAKFEAKDGWDIQTRISEILTKLGAPDDAMGKTFGEFSGGQQSRILLAGQLIQEPDVLLLDEPTNNLDRNGLLWLEKYLADYRGAVAVVSHDREFLDNTVTKILEIDGSGGEPAYYEGGYTKYRAEKSKRLANHALALEAQRKNENQLISAIEKSKQRSQNTHGKSTNAYFRDKAANMDRSRLAMQSRLDRNRNGSDWLHEKDEKKSLPLELTGRSKRGQRLIAATALRLGYGMDAPAIIDDATFTIHGQDRVAITGDNGSGKTTLLGAMAGNKDIVQSGEIKTFADSSYLTQTDAQEAVKASDDKLLDWFRDHVGAIHESEAAALLVWFGFDKHQLRQPVKKLSPGEVSKLALLGMTYSGKELLLLDEPTNHLDFDALDVVEDVLDAFKGTLVTVSHDRQFLENISCNRTLEVGKGKVTCTDL